jgi:methionyl-tRNA formyltransferase
VNLKNPRELRILYLSKKDNEYAKRAADYVRENFKDPLIYSGDRRKPLPADVLDWKGDLLISFISSWILPEKLLNNAGYAAINFHPGSPEYPGTGCTNFAIYEDAKEYGVTCHHMRSKVDAGPIIQVKRFAIEPDDSVFKVTQQCYKLIEEMFYEIMNGLLEGKELPASDEKWKRKPFTRKELDELCHITPGMTEDEIKKRIRATTYKTPWAFTKIGPHVFKLQA